MAAEMVEVLEKAKLRDSNEKGDKFGFTEDFYRFIGFGKRMNDYRWSMSQYAEPQYNKIKSDFAEDASPNFYTPIDNFYGSGSGGDMAYDYGRVPVSHLMPLADQRLGILFRGCNGVANDVYRNRFDFVSNKDPDTPIIKDEIRRYMDRSEFWDKIVNQLDFNFRSGLGLLVSKWNNEKKFTNMRKPAPKTRPDTFQSFSAYYFTPINIYESAWLDYQKQKWDFIGGLMNPTQIDSSRIHVLETHRVEYGLRGRAIAELCWVPLMCYLNTAYYVLKALSKLGTVQTSINIDKEYPSPTDVAAYVAVYDAMTANNCIVLGRNATATIHNAAGQIGSGINSYLEFLIEDISSAWIFPKNQLLGRSDGGGLDGAGALISKEDYLSSNLAVKQIQLTNDLMYIFREVCHFPNMEDITLRWNIDLHKTQEQRYTEELMKEQVEVAKIGTEQAKLGNKLYKKQVKLQMEMADVQEKMMEKDPEVFMQSSEEDEENLDKDNVKKAKEDFMEYNYLQRKYDMLSKQFLMNNKMLKGLLLQRKMLDQGPRLRDVKWK